MWSLPLSRKSVTKTKCLLASAAAVTVLCFGASVWSASAPHASPVAAQARPHEEAAYIRRGALPPRLRGALGALGDRLERPGKERLVLEGTLERDGQTLPVRLVTEAPGRLRLELRGGMAASSSTTSAARETTPHG